MPDFSLRWMLARGGTLDRRVGFPCPRSRETGRSAINARPELCQNTFGRAQAPSSPGTAVHAVLRLDGGNEVATYNVLIMGASYGSLLASKLLFAGHNVTLVCLPAEVEAINADGIRVRLPIKGRTAPVEIDSRTLPGRLSAAGPGDVNPADYDLIALAMQEPQYRSPGVRELLDKVARSRVPCMSIMNMPPLPYLKRIPGLATADLAHCYTDASVWENFDPALMTLCSPDPQAFRPPEEKINVLQVTLPTNFKAARIEGDSHTAILRQMQSEIEAIRFDAGDATIDLPVKLKVHELGVRTAGQVGDAGHRQLPLRAAGFGAIDQGCRAHRPRRLARDLRVGARHLRGPRRVARRHGAVREIRRRGERPGAAVVGGTRAVRRRTEHRAGGSPGAGHRGAAGQAERDARRDGGDGRRAAGDEPEGRFLNVSRLRGTADA